MIICDNCKNLKKPAFECSLDLLKKETKKTRSIKGPVIHLCEECITKTLSQIHQQVFGLRMKEPS